MSSSYFIRIRGKPQGPYNADQLRAFVKRGQLSRLHEVSIDGATWARASNYPELFSSGQAAFVEPMGLGPDADTSARDDSLFGLDDANGVPAKGERQSRAASQGLWYYTKDGEECGPVDFGTLQRLAASGGVGAQERVWTEGMADWASPQTVPGLTSSAPSAGTVFADFKDLSADLRHGLFPAADTGKPGEVSAEACRAIAGTRPWMLFIAVILYLDVAIAILGGIITISFENGIIGLAQIIGGVLVAVGATLLVMCFNRLGHVLHTKRHSELEIALHAVRRFWLFNGILLIVCLSVALISVLVLLAIGSSIAHLPEL